MKKLFPFLTEYKKEIFLAPLFKMLEAIFDLLVPIIVASMIDIGIYQNQKSFLFKQFAILILLAVIGYVSSVVAQYFSAKASTGFVVKIRQVVFERIGQLSYAQLDTLGISTLITRMTADMQTIQTGFNFSLRLLLRSPFVVFGSLFMAFTIDTKSAMVFLITIPILSCMVAILIFLSIPVLERVQRVMDQFIAFVRENILGMRVIRSFRKENIEVNAFQQLNQSFTRLNMKAAKLSSLMNPLTYTTVNIAIIALLVVCALQVNRGLMVQGKVVALYHYMGQILIELLKLAQLIVMMNKAIVSAKRVNQVLEIEPEMKYPNHISHVNSNQAIIFEHVSFSYHNRSDYAIQDITFSLRQGEILGVIGGIGSGKSTLVQLIARLYDTTDGKIQVLGKKIQDFSALELNEKVAIVPQKSVLFSGTIRENLKLGNEYASDDDLWFALEMAQAREIVEKKEGQLDALVEQGGNNFSGGQKQRLAIARALVKKPLILILDDSSSALDFVTEARLRISLAQLNLTLVIVSQRISSIEHADHIMVLDDGHMVGFARHTELLQNCRVYQEIYTSQFKEDETHSMREVSV